MQLDLPVGEEHERGRGDSRLRHVVDANLFGSRHGGSLEVDLLEETVHLAGGNALAPLSGHFLHQLEQCVNVFAGRR